MTTKRSPAFASDDWMFEQQVRAELEAEAWRRLRAQMSAPETLAPPAPAPAPAPQAQVAPIKPNPHRTGSGVLKGLVRFVIAGFCAYLAWIAAMDDGLGEAEIWFAVASVFIATLALSALEPARKIVHFMAETARWVLIFGFVFGVAWVLTHAHAALS